MYLWVLIAKRLFLHRINIEDMNIKKDKVVSLIYELRLGSAEGDIVESLTEDRPLTFLYGSGNLLPKFEENIDGLTTGDSFKFDLAAGDAYGEVNDAAIVDVPIAAFEMDGKVDNEMLKLGNTIPMRDNAGNRLNGMVKEVTDANVKMDFNHPLAGNHLFFSGSVTEIREATEEELSQGNINAGGGCGCDSGGCSEEKSESGCGSGGCGC